MESEEQHAEQPKIPISICAGTPFVWSVKGELSKFGKREEFDRGFFDARRLREQHHICGLNSGTLPQVAQQNIFLGLPLQLMPEEVVLLVTERLAYLVDDAAAHHSATSDQVAEALNARVTRIAEQQQQQLAMLQEKQRHIEETMSDAIAQARQAKAAKKRQKGIDDTVSTREVTKIPDIAYNVEIAGSSDELPWYQPDQHSFYTLANARSANLWTYPSTRLQRAKCAVYADLWRRGYFMGIGIKFGGDFLVYKGDPLRYHSHFSTTVVASLEDRIDAMAFVADGRLATGVKKAHLFCAYDPEQDKVSYMSLEWSGMG